MNKQVSYLALGDSYTIGEQVPPTKSYPIQTASLLRKQGLALAKPTVIAQTGWTTTDLLNTLSRVRLAGPFEVASLLIGVNNQYRGFPLSEYEQEFRQLLQQTIGYVGDRPNRVIVLSIPDWGVTPFAKDLNQRQIAEEIDAFNQANLCITSEMGSAYLDITEQSRLAQSQPQLLAADGLHLSAQAYAIWAGLLAKKIKELIKP